MKITTVLGFKKNFEKAKELKVGDVVTLEKEPTNPNDADAVKVLLNDEQVGYIASSPHTIIEGTLSAKEVGELNPFASKARLLRLNNEDNFKTSFEAEILEEKEEEKSKKELNFNVTGGVHAYPMKKKLADDIKSSPRMVKISKISDELVIEYDNNPAGKIKADDEVCKTITDILEDGGEIIATAISVDRMTIKCTLNLDDVKVVTAEDIRMEIKKEVKRIMDSGIATANEMRERLDYLRGCNVPDIAIRNLFKTFKVYPEEVRSRIPKKPDVVYIDSGTIVFDAISFMNIGSHIRAEGEKGVGKNVLAKTLAWVSYRPEYNASLNSQLSNNTLLGGLIFKNKLPGSKSSFSFVDVLKGITNIIKLTFFKKGNELSDREVESIDEFFKGIVDRGGKELVFEKSNILEAFEVGGILVLDEFNTTLPHVMSLFNSVLDDRRSIEVTNLGKVDGDPNFCAFITQNKNYEGTFQTNQATVNRFRPLLFPQVKSIAAILQERVPTVSYDVVIEADKLYKVIMNSVRSGQMDEQAVSLRGFIAACQLLEQGQTLKDAFIKSVANEIDDLEARKAVINMIDAQLG